MAHGWCVVWAEKLQRSNMQYGSHIEAISYLVLCHCSVLVRWCWRALLSAICCHAFLAIGFMFYCSRHTTYHFFIVMNLCIRYTAHARAVCSGRPSTSFRQGASFFSLLVDASAHDRHIARDTGAHQHQRVAALPAHMPYMPCQTQTNQALIRRCPHWSDPLSPSCTLPDAPVPLASTPSATQLVSRLS